MNGKINLHYSTNFTDQEPPSTDHHSPVSSSRQSLATPEQIKMVDTHSYQGKVEDINFSLKHSTAVSRFLP